MTEKDIVEEIVNLITTRKLRFPSPPTVAIKLNAVLNAETTTTADIAEIVQEHVVLSAKLMQVANSSALRRGPEITTLANAIQRLGSSFVRNLALALLLKEQFSPVNGLVMQSVTELWEYSTKAGAYCFLAANMMKDTGSDLDGSPESEAFRKATRGLDPSTALTVGIIHRIGELPLAEFALQHGYQAQVVHDLPRASKVHLTAGMLSAWELPTMLIEAIEGKGVYGEILEFVHGHLEGDNNLLLGVVSQEAFTAYVEEQKATAQEITSAFN